MSTEESGQRIAEMVSHLKDAVGALPQRPPSTNQADLAVLDPSLAYPGLRAITGPSMGTSALAPGPEGSPATFAVAPSAKFKVKDTAPLTRGTRRLFCWAALAIAAASAVLAAAVAEDATAQVSVSAIAVTALSVAFFVVMGFKNVEYEVGIAGYSAPDKEEEQDEEEGDEGETDEEEGEEGEAGGQANDARDE